ncbi:Ribosomal protein L31e [Giardia muris]|uniref:Ribosomal protein L31e n=1 Tax=Giardia muris TaxID=5742 RepID=A0A4Z1T3H5_GIAMU|nr:Ribosomal protein L31e [Giardia muris]|eukprot:TNJ26961.1 Ribosomal protein L31e [Giardia muris]
MPVTYEHTMRLRRVTTGTPGKKCAPTAMRLIRDYVTKLTKIEDVRLDPSVNCFVWSRGIRHLPRRIRIEINVVDQEDHKYVIVAHKQVETFKGLTTEKKIISE